MIENKRKKILDDQQDWSPFEDFLMKSLQPVTPNPAFKYELEKKLKTGTQISLEGLDKSKVIFYSGLALVGGIMFIALVKRILIPIVSMLRLNVQSISS